jgi:Fe/S biogenesis protein NfuA
MMDKATREKLEEIMARDVRPLLATHGGSVTVTGMTDENYVTVKMLGVCSSCSAAQQTLKEIIETAVMEKMPQVKGVLLDSQVSQALIDEALSIIRHKKNANE